MAADNVQAEARRWTLPHYVAGALAAAIAFYFALRMSYPDATHARRLVDGAALALIGMIAAVSLWLAARRCADEPRTATAWRFLSAACCFVTAGFTAMLIYELRNTPVPLPSVGDALFICYYPLLVIGLLRFPTRPQSRTGEQRLLIDALIVVIGAASVIWFFVLGPVVTQPGLSTLALTVAGAFPVGDVLVAFGLSYTVMRGLIPASRTALSLCTAAAGLTLLLNMTVSWFRLEGNFSVVGNASVGFVVVFAIFALGGACQRPLDADQLRASTDHPRRDRHALARKRALLPYLGPAIVFGLLIGAQFGSATYLRVGLAVCAAVLAALVLLRQFLAQRDLIDAQSQLSHQAMHDALTGLPNRALVLDRAEQMLARARRNLSPVAALFLDIDGFKHVNDTFGHAAGDELLKVIAARLQGLIRESDTVGRMGGDEFVVLLDSPTFDVAPDLVAERILEVLREQVELTSAGDRTFTITASIGIAVGLRQSADELLRDADMALYAAKGDGKNCFVLFESSMQTAARDRLLLEMDLRAGVENEQFFLLYQPTFDLQSERVTGVEALVRWRHPDRGVIAPDLFIPLAEETGIIGDLGRWVLDEACRQAAEWHGNGHPIGIAVNVSGRQLDDDAIIVDHVREALAASGLPPAALTLEITETALMRDPDRAAERLRQLKTLGVRIAIDDFGTGYSSMAYLRQFPVDALKIDQSFISGIAATTESSSAIVHSLVQLGKTLKLEVLGEGIEEAVQLRSLQREQCDSGQGFLFARPLEADEIESFIEATGRVGSRVS